MLKCKKCSGMDRIYLHFTQFKTCVTLYIWTFTLLIYKYVNWGYIEYVFCCCYSCLQIVENIIYIFLAKTYFEKFLLFFNSIIFNLLFFLFQGQNIEWLLVIPTRELDINHIYFLLYLDPIQLNRNCKLCYLKSENCFHKSKALCL